MTTIREGASFQANTGKIPCVSHANSRGSQVASDVPSQFRVPLGSCKIEMRLRNFAGSYAEWLRIASASVSFWEYGYEVRYKFPVWALYIGFWRVAFRFPSFGYGPVLSSVVQL